MSCSSSLLSYLFLAQIDCLQLILDLEYTSTFVALAFSKELFKLFMQTYIDIVKNQTIIQALPDIIPVPIKLKDQSLKANCPDMPFWK